MYFEKEIDSQLEVEVAILYNFSMEILTVKDLEMKLLVRLMQKNKLKSLLSFMNTVFIPSIMNEESWPDNVKK